MLVSGRVLHQQFQGTIILMVGSTYRDPIGPYYGWTLKLPVESMRMMPAYAYPLVTTTCISYKQIQQIIQRCWWSCIIQVSNGFHLFHHIITHHPSPIILSRLDHFIVPSQNVAWPCWSPWLLKYLLRLSSLEDPRTDPDIFENVRNQRRYPGPWNERTVNTSENRPNPLKRKGFWCFPSINFQESMLVSGRGHQHFGRGMEIWRKVMWIWHPMIVKWWSNLVLEHKSSAIWQVCYVCLPSTSVLWLKTQTILLS